MKNFLVAGILILANIIWVQACTTCGGSSTGSDLGIMPQNNTNYFGINWRYRGYKSVDRFEHGQTIVHSNQLELAGAYFPLKNWQLSASLPVTFSKRYNAFFEDQKAGVGDMSILSTYYFELGKDSIVRKLRHQLIAIAGIKLPTGRFENNTDLLSANFQAGTGSVDYIISMGYNANIGKWGVNGNFLYKINTKNKEEYAFGNQQILAVSASYKFFFRKTGREIFPFAGLMFEHYERDNNADNIAKATGGEGLSLTIGTRTYLNNFFIGWYYLHPLYDHYRFEDFSSDKVRTRPRVQVSLGYLFNGKNN